MSLVDEYERLVRDPRGDLTPSEYVEDRLNRQLARGDGRCVPQCAGSNWRDAPHPTRSGWTRTTCRLCGRWIGDRPRELAR
jgi:hypothetical protein